MDAIEKQSLTEGVIWKKMLMFALPIFLGNLFQQLYNAVDALIVGQFMDEAALAAVTSSGSLIFLLVGFFHGVAIGAGVIISKCFGAKDHEKLRLVIHTNVAFGVILGGVLTVIGVVFSPIILRWMGTPENVLPNSIAYFRMYFCGGLFIVLYNTFVGILQAVGDSKHPLYYLIISSIINVILDLLFIGVFKWGVWSAAFATTIAQGVSTCLAFSRLVRAKDVYRLRLREIRIHWNSLRNIVRFGLPSGVQNSMISIANVVVQSNVNAFGDIAMAGCGSYSKIEGFAFLPVSCFAMALSTFVGQNLGARQYDRVKKGVRFGIICSVLMAELVGISVFILAPHLVGLFSDSAKVVAFGVRQARVVSLFYFLMAFSHCIAGVMRGAGKPTVPMAVMMASWCFLRITYITIAVRLIPEIEVVFSAYPLTWSVSSIIFLIYFLKADWIHNFDRLDAKHT